MAHRHRHPPPKTTEPSRLGRLMVRERRAAAAQERIPELLPATCPDCHAVLGLVIVGGAIWCKACGRWATTDETAGMVV